MNGHVSGYFIHFNLFFDDCGDPVTGGKRPGSGRYVQGMAQPFLWKGAAF
jgi:hypothetical protein